MQNTTQTLAPTTPETFKPTQLKSDTRTWNSGRVKFAVIGWKGKPEKNYIIFEKDFLTGQNKNQRFNLLYKDWINLKKLIDEELSINTEWATTIKSLGVKEIDSLLVEDPDLIKKILESKNIFKISETSIESLDKLILKVYDIKKEKIDLILKRLSDTNPEEIESFGTLLEDLKISQISMMATIVYQKLKVLTLLENLVISSSSKEKDIHQLFESNPWLLGQNYEILKSEKTLSDYLNINIKDDPELKKRPDIIAKIAPYSNKIVLIEFKSAQIKLKAKHVGQVLEYKSLIKNYRPNSSEIECFLFGYEKENSWVESNDVTIKTFSEIISEKRQEYECYQKVLEEGKEVS